MTNLALGLAQLALLLLSYTSVDRWSVSLAGFDLRYLVTLAMLILLWATVQLLFKRMCVSVVIGPMYLLLALANVLSLLTFLVHAYNAYLPANHVGAAPSVEEIMAPRFSMMAEIYLRAAYPFAKVLLVVSTVALVVPLIRSLRRRGSNAD